MATSDRPGNDEARVLAGRYRLRARLGQGANGEVWEADDCVIGERVAIKLLIQTGEESARVRREIATLRMLRLPGVVRLLDEGTDDGRPFFVMELIEGAPFPGYAPSHENPGALLSTLSVVKEPSETLSLGSTASSSAIRAKPNRRAALPKPDLHTWDEIAEAVDALFEILARVHSAGIVHRDLKPANVLVHADGRPVILDFGLALGRAHDARITQEGRILGTPAYLSPEQIHGGTIDARSDLYAVGAMLYEALTGSLPHAASTLQGLLMLRLTQAATPVRDRVPSIPPHAAALIDRLLAGLPEDRPRSAAEARTLLRGESPVRHVDHDLPRLGGDAAVRAVVAAAREGRAIDVVGPRGSGKSRCIEEAAEVLEREGRRVLRLPPGRRPLASLSPVTGSLEELSRESMDEVLAHASARLAQALDTGVVIVADDVDRLDRWSSELLDKHRQAGALLRGLFRSDVSEDAVQLAPIEESALRPLFAGPDRLFHLREDAARILWQRSVGLPARLVAELDAWVRTGFARWDGEHFVVERNALDRLASGLPAAGSLPEWGVMRLGMEEPHLEELLAWLGVAASALDAGHLAEILGQPRFRVEAELDELCTRSLAFHLGEGRFIPLVHTNAGWSEQARRDAQLAIADALTPGEPERLFFLIAAGEDEEAAREALILAQQMAAEGRLGRAEAALHEGILAARRCAGEEVEAQILTAWAKVAFAERRTHALDRVLYEVCRSQQRASSEITRLEGLVRAALLVDGPSWRENARDAADALGPFEDPELERWRHWVRVRAGIRESPEAAEAALHEAEAWSRQTDHPVARTSVAGWRGLILYEQGQFEASARAHAEAAEGETWLPLRLASTLNEATSLLEAFEAHKAAERACAAGKMAARCRHPYFEARAEWTHRTAAYRTQMVTALDLALVEAFAALGVPEHFALLCCTEAAIAYRAGDNSLAGELMGRALEIWRRHERRWPTLLARSFIAAMSGDISDEEASRLVTEASCCPVPGIGIQALAFLRCACPRLSPFPDELVASLCRGVAEEHWDERLDVLSIRESLAMAVTHADDTRTDT